MAQCIGYGKYKGVCTNDTADSSNVLFCKRCLNLRKDEQKKQKEEHEHNTTKIKNYENERGE